MPMLFGTQVLLPYYTKQSAWALIQFTRKLCMTGHANICCYIKIFLNIINLVFSLMVISFLIKQFCSCVQAWISLSSYKFMSGTECPCQQTQSPVFTAKCMAPCQTACWEAVCVCADWQWVQPGQKTWVIWCLLAKTHLVITERQTCAHLNNEEEK